MTIATGVLSALLGYLLGAIPTGVVVARLWHGVDVIHNGSGHTGGLNVYRTTGNRWAFVLTGVLDCALGALAVSLARAWFPVAWAGPLAGVMAVVGHNWSVFIGLRGGVGISSLTGAMLTLSPTATLAGAVILVVSWLVVQRVLRHSARSTTVVMLLLGPAMWLLRQPTAVLALGTFGAIPIILKELGDFGRVYERSETETIQPRGE
jgi:glycerol-3-phosphate acyltransferase PlsY